MATSEVSGQTTWLRVRSERSVWDLPLWYIPVFKFLLFMVFGLIALGGATRVMKAGLACPDWPLCFGDWIPDYHPQVYFEFLHRALAGVVALVTIALQYILIVESSAPRALKWLGGFVVALLLTQVVFGGLTVLLQLQSMVVATHLGLGTGFFALLVWIYLSLRAQEDRRGARVASRAVLVLSVFSVVMVYGQILLGGLVASHFASLICLDFPKCNGQWIPTLSGPVGLHVIHRFGAYFVFAASLGVWWFFARQVRDVALARGARGVFLLICVQVVVGISNVLLKTPPLIAVIHLAVATAILGLVVRQLHDVVRPYIK